MHQELRLRGAGDELKARLSGRKVGPVLEDLMSQLERMPPEGRANRAGHAPDQVLHQLRSLHKRISDAKMGDMTFLELGKMPGISSTNYFLLVASAVQTGAKF